MIAKLKDPLSGLTHFIGIWLAVVGLVLLILKSSDPVKPWHIATFCIFSSGMILLYLASTLYHWLPLSEAGSNRLKKFDHMMIFVMIAASYTPICLIPLRGPIDGLCLAVYGGSQRPGCSLRSSGSRHHAGCQLPYTC